MAKRPTDRYPWASAGHRASNSPAILADSGPWITNLDRPDRPWRPYEAGFRWHHPCIYPLYGAVRTPPDCGRKEPSFEGD